MFTIDPKDFVKMPTSFYVKTDVETRNKVKMLAIKNNIQMGALINRMIKHCLNDLELNNKKEKK